MLTLSCCRELLGADCTLTDEEVMELQVQMRAIAEIAFVDNEEES